MIYNTFRKDDMRREQLLSAYLDEKLYCQSPFYNVKRTDSTESQFSGCDIIFSIPSLGLSNIIVDEKAQLYYLDGGLPTFAFELNFINKNGQRAEGWLTDENKKTEYYQLLFLTAKNNFESIDEIFKVEYILVERSKIIQAINLDLPTLRRIGIEVSKCSDFRQFKNSGLPYYFTHSIKLAESPVNIILRKEKLIEISSLIGEVK